MPYFKPQSCLLDNRILQYEQAASMLGSTWSLIARDFKAVFVYKHERLMGLFCKKFLFHNNLLDWQAFEKARNNGSTMTLQEAVAYACTMD